MLYQFSVLNYFVTFCFPLNYHVNSVRFKLDTCPDGRPHKFFQMRAELPTPKNSTVHLSFFFSLSNAAGHTHLTYVKIDVIFSSKISGEREWNMGTCLTCYTKASNPQCILGHTFIHDCVFTLIAPCRLLGHSQTTVCPRVICSVVVSFATK